MPCGDVLVPVPAVPAGVHADGRLARSDGIWHDWLEDAALVSVADTATRRGGEPAGAGHGEKV